MSHDMSGYFIIGLADLMELVGASPEEFFFEEELTFDCAYPHCDGECPNRCCI